MSEEDWASADRYLEGVFGAEDDALLACRKANVEGGLPPIDVSALQGKFLFLLAQIQGAHRILEIGTLGGYSTIWLGRALPADGRLVSLELEAKHAAVARANVSRAGLAGKVEIIEGPASETLARLCEGGMEPFDFIFIDADKTGYPEYLALSLKLSRVGTVIVGDNVVRRGAIANGESTDENVIGVRRFIEMAAAEPRLSAVVMQTVGAKGHDGLLISRVVG